MSLQRASHCATDITSSEHAPFVRLCVQADEYPHFRDMLGGKQSPFWNWATGRMNGTSSHGQKRTSVLFVSVSFIILMLISLAWLIFYYVQRFRYIHAKDQLERKLCNQAKKALQIISTSVLKKDDLEDKDFCDTCAVCIENCKFYLFKQSININFNAIQSYLYLNWLFYTKQIEWKTWLGSFPANTNFIKAALTNGYSKKGHVRCARWIS